MEVAPGRLDSSQPATSRSTVAFEWALETTSGGVEKETVTAYCYHVFNAKRPSDVPAPRSLGRARVVAHVATAQLQEEATKAVAAHGGAALRERFGDDVERVDCRYLGVETSANVPDLNSPADRRSLLLFEWVSERPSGVERHVVLEKCKYVLLRGVPLPTESKTTDPAKLHEKAAVAATTRDSAKIRAACGDGVELLGCRYLGVETQPGVPDPTLLASEQSKLLLEWTLRRHSREEKRVVSATCKNVLAQDVPLPKRKFPKTRTELEG